MPYSYDAGTTTPYLAGLVEFNGIRLNDGTFKLTDLSGLLNSPSPRVPLQSLPADSGGFLGTQYYDPLQFTLGGYIDVDSVAYLDPALDQLKGAFNLSVGAQTLVFNRTGWSQRRQVTAYVAGPITVAEPQDLQKAVPERDFQIPLVAPDPIQYDADNLQTVVLPMDNTNHTLTNSGTVPVGFTARFTGPWNTAASLIRNSDGAKITLTMTLAAGHYVDVVMMPGSISATQDGTTNVYYTVTDQLATQIAVGSNSWHAAGSSGTTGASQVSVSYRYGWC